MVCKILSVCPARLITLLFLSPDPVTVQQCRLGGSTLSNVGSDPVSDVVLQPLPRAVPQRFHFSVQTPNAVVFLRDLMSLNETHHLFFNSSNLLFSPFVFTTAPDNCGTKKRLTNLHIKRLMCSCSYRLFIKKKEEELQNLGLKHHFLTIIYVFYLFCLKRWTLRLWSLWLSMMVDMIVQCKPL